MNQNDEQLEDRQARRAMAWWPWMRDRVLLLGPVPQGQKRNRRVARRLAWSIFIPAFMSGVILLNKFPTSTAGLWVTVLSLGTFVVLFLGLGDITQAIKQLAFPITKAILGLLALAVALVLLFRFAPSLFPESPWAYALRYDMDSGRIVILPKPTDCDFLHAPVGFKGCRYEKSVQVTRYDKDAHSGLPIVSHDDGKTWSPLTGDERPGPTEVYVGWDRVADTR